MVLQGSGQITLKDVAGEFGGSTPHNLSEYYAAATGVPGTGPIRLSNFYGKSNNPNPPTWTTGTNLGLTTPSTYFSTSLLAYSDSSTTLSLTDGPSGFSFNPSSSGLNGSATISGTTPSSNTTLYWYVRATDQEGQTTDRTFSLRVSQVPVFSTSSVLPQYATNTLFGIQISASSDSAVTFTMNSNPYGFGSIQSNGYFDGTTPSYGGTFYWYFTATDQEGQSTTQYYQMSVSVPVPPSWYTNAYDLDPLYNGNYLYLGGFSSGGYVVYTFSNYANGTGPFTYGAGELTSLSLNSSTGVVSGYMPTVASGIRVYWYMYLYSPYGSAAVTVVAESY